MKMSYSKLGPATSSHACSITDYVKLQISSHGLDSIEPKSIIDVFEEATSKFATNSAIGYMDNSNNWTSITYNEFHGKVMQIAKAFLKLQLNKGDTVAIFANNCPEWLYTAFGTFYAGGINVGIYFTSLNNTIFEILYTSNSKIVIVQDAEGMLIIKNMKSKLPNLKYIFQINGPIDLNSMEGYYCWSYLEQINTKDFEIELENRMKSTYVNECCSVIYTSGTTGQSKAIMLSHDGLIWGCRTALQSFKNIDYGNEVIISYHPLNHLAIQTYEIFIPILMGACIYFTDRNAISDLRNTLKTIHPTRLFGVPSVWKKLEEHFKIEIEQNFNEINKIIKLESSDARNLFNSPAYEEMCNQLLIKFGLHKCKLFLTAGAPISKDIKIFFMKIKIILTELYGATEAHTVSMCSDNLDYYNMDSCGYILEGVAAKIKNPDETGEGEVCVKGRSIFMGYLNQLDKTNEVLDDNWLKTGDLGRIDEHKALYITGRIKDIIITLGGIKVPTIYIESLIKSELPGINHAILIGNNQKYLSVLITIKTEIDSNTGLPLNKLAHESLKWMQLLKLKYENLSEIHDNGPEAKVLQSIQDGINRANNKTISNAHKIQKFIILPNDFSIPTGEIGPTSKIKRNVIYEKYASIINKIYD